MPVVFIIKLGFCFVNEILKNIQNIYNDEKKSEITFGRQNADAQLQSRQCLLHRSLFNVKLNSCTTMKEVTDEV
jgi:hypothetical protein